MSSCTTMSDGPPKKAAPGPPQKAASAAPIGRATVTYDYAKEADGELELKAGDVVDVLQKADGGWWKGRSNGATGWFPEHYVTESGGGGGGASPFGEPAAPAGFVGALAKAGSGQGRVGKEGCLWGRSGKQ